MMLERDSDRSSMPLSAVWVCMGRCSSLLMSWVYILRFRDCSFWSICAMSCSLLELKQGMVFLADHQLAHWSELAGERQMPARWVVEHERLAGAPVIGGAEAG